jgi:hypothetical protein
MNAELLFRERQQVAPNAFVEMRIWRVPAPVQGSNHQFKYSFAYVVAGKCVLRYDNEAKKGDHRHLGAIEESYNVTTPAQLLADFWFEVDRWRPA